MRRMKTVDIYTDGACSGNPGKGGYGVVMLYGSARKELSEGFSRTTNNRMEVLAVITGLASLKESCNVNLYSDSKYVVNAIEQGWLEGWKKNGWKKSNKGAVLNVDLWKKLDEQLKKHNVKFIWVKGHAENVENERCDQLAREAASGINLSTDEEYKG
jgi:ribonuclease HI